MATSPNVVLVPLNLPVKTISGAFLLYIPYSGTALAIPDLVSAKVDVKFDSLVTGLPYAKRR